MGRRNPSKRSKAPSKYPLRSRARRVCHRPALYEYRALDTSKQEVRILKLEYIAPAKSTTDNDIRPVSASESIRGSITHVPLSELQKFVALSYTWGEPEKKQSLLVDGGRIPITKNLHEVLQHLCRRQEFAHVWIDAVCINQEDKDEKSSQIQLLSKIFRSAKEVIAWIGMHDDDTSFLFSFVKKHSLEDEEARNPGEVRTRLNKALTALGKRAYWTRVWILQEFAVAKRVRIMCADDLVDSDMISDLTSEFMRGMQLLVSPFHAMYMARRRYHENRPIGLLEMLMVGTASMHESLYDRVIWRAFKSSDIIDQIYGLLGLVDDQMMFLLEPNYKIKNLNQLFIDMTRRFVSMSRQVELCFLQHGKEPVDPKYLGVTETRSYTPTELPDWCPDYLNLVHSAQNGEMINALESRQETPAQLTGPKHRDSEPSLSWNATAGSRLTSGSYHLYDDGGILLMGKLVGTIVSPSDWETHVASSAFKTDDDDELSCFPWLNLLLFAYTAHPILTNDQILDAVLFLISDDKCFLERAFEDAAFVPNCCDDERTELKEKVSGNGAPDDLICLIFRRLSEWSIATDQPTAVSSEELHQVADQITVSLLSNYRCLERKIAAYRANERDMRVSRVAQESGAYSWVPSSARPYDEIWLLEGCSVPIVLRRVAQPMATGPRIFARIGPALVNGAMKGDMWSDNDLSSMIVVKTSDTVDVPSSCPF